MGAWPRETGVPKATRLDKLGLLESNLMAKEKESKEKRERKEKKERMVVQAESLCKDRGLEVNKYGP